MGLDFDSGIANDYGNARSISRIGGGQMVPGIVLLLNRPRTVESSSEV